MFPLWGVSVCVVMSGGSQTGLRECWFLRPHALHPARDLRKVAFCETPSASGGTICSLQLLRGSVNEPAFLAESIGLHVAFICLFSDAGEQNSHLMPRVTHQT